MSPLQALIRLMVGVSLTGGLLACTENESRSNTEPDDAAVGGSESAGFFIDATVSTGLTFEHMTFASADRYLPEIVGAGVALLDYDNDGDLDVYFIQGGHPVNGTASEHSNRLFRNDLDRTGVLMFTDVSKTSGLDDPGYGMGVACGDIDNDGDTDMYVTNVGANVLYRNDGNGRFSDITSKAGVDDQRWGASAAFADYDGDGFLDLFVTNYVANSVEDHRECDNLSGQSDYCSPTAYEGTSDILFRNLGDGTFTDISSESGIATEKAAGLGVIAADFDNNGHIDFYVANDQSANFFWRNTGNGHFEEYGLLSGSAYNGHGMAEASMGVTAADFDGDGDEDLFMTHLNAQTNTLYRNDGAGHFQDVTSAARLDSASLLFTGFGAKWFDIDNDADFDLFVANGAVIAEPLQLETSDFPYAQRNQLFINDGNGRYREWTDRPAGPLASVAVSRGTAIGDLDNDGDLDVVVSNGNGVAQVLLNTHNHKSDWLGLTLVGSRSNSDAIGARVLVRHNEQVTRSYRVHRDGSYLSSNDARVHIGLPGQASAKEGLQNSDELLANEIDVEVIWPHGTREHWRNLPIGQYSKLVEGAGEP